jgi:hypothetical protein
VRYTNNHLLDSRKINNNQPVIFFSMSRQPIVGQGFFIVEVSRSHSDTPHSVGLLWRSDQLGAETSNNYTRYPFPPWDSNLQSQVASGLRPTPQTAQPLGSAELMIISAVQWILDLG